MTVCAALIVRDAEATLEACLESAAAVCDMALVVDTGSKDGTVELARELGADVRERPWVDFGHNRTELLTLARGKADWLLLVDADMTVWACDEHNTWFDGDPDPDVAAWMVRVEEDWGWYRLPLLIRNDREWRYEGRTHEALVVGDVKKRDLLGFAVYHHPTHGREKHERDLELLRDGFVVGDPRSTFYTAQALRGLGLVEEAAEVYATRARMNEFEEEAWYAQYQAATLREDVPGLLKAWRRRPHRHEPLSAAARIVASMDSDDVLFRESP